MRGLRTQRERRRRREILALMVMAVLGLKLRLEVDCFDAPSYRCFVGGRGFTYSGECRLMAEDSAAKRVGESAGNLPRISPAANDEAEGNMTMRWLKVMLLSMTTAMTAHGLVT